MPYIKKIFSILCIVSIGFFLWLFLFDKPYPNNINIIAPDLDKFTGETYIARDLAQYFSAKGKNVKLFNTKTYSQEENFDYCGRSINIFIYGYIPSRPNRNGINIIYLLYPELPSISYEGFDLIAVASKKYAKELAENGFRTTYIPQGTNTSLFKHKPQKNGIDLLFVGSRHSEDDYRPSVKYAIQNDFPVHVYGIRWEGHISPKYLKGNFISNNDLHKYYSSAKIILNDHRQDMREAGFVANRIFDVTASQGFIISDYMPEIEEIYGDSIPMWHNEVEFKNLVNYYLNHPEERAKKSQKAHKITMKNYTIDAIGARFEEEIKKLFQERKSKN